MDDLSFLVSETLKHFKDHYGPLPEIQKQALEVLEIPKISGLIYHIQETSHLFVVRSLSTENLQQTWQKILEKPEDFPSLRLIEEGKILTDKLKWFETSSLTEADFIQRQISHRRFSKDEDLVGNLSDPSEQWWLWEEEKTWSLGWGHLQQVSSKAQKLGSLGPGSEARSQFYILSGLMNKLNYPMNIEVQNFRLTCSKEEALSEELKDLFEFGQVGEGLTQFFKMAVRRLGEKELETLWFYFKEIAALRRFWIQIDFSLNA